MPVNIRTKSMWIFACTLIQVAVGKNGFHRQSNTGVEFCCQFLDVFIFVICIQIQVIYHWCFLEERVVIMPGHKLRNGHLVFGS
ncbi:hypothetical protein ES707_13471 [subsurface metagenome]